MRAFISHNKIDGEFARTLAMALVAVGSDVWFDEWEIKPGSSIIGGIQAGLTGAEAFVIVWSNAAAKSNWVDAELAAFLHRQIKDQSLKIIPVMLDDTPLPALLADFKGVHVDQENDAVRIAAGILENGAPDDSDLAQLLQRRLNELAKANADPNDPFADVIVCRACGSKNLKYTSRTDERTTIYVIRCEDCDWGDWTE